MKNILFPTDFSENAWNALKYAQQLFNSASCNFYLLHVSDYIDYPTRAVSFKNENEVETQELIIPSKKKLNELLHKVETLNKNPKHKFFGIHESGFFLEAIKKHSKEKKVDLIVMGTKGASGMRQRIIGSNTGDVITKVQCNTLIIPLGVQFTVPKEVAFPTDYNIFYAHKILEAITEMLHYGKANIRVLKVSKIGRKLSELQEKNKEYLEDYLNETFPEKNSFHTITNRNVNAAIQCFVESRDVDMIIMVAKNLNFIQQVLFDSLVEKISFHSTVPFFVIHE